jgi:hypothetical protein
MNIIRRINWLNVLWKYGIERLERKYARLTEQTERAAFLMETFGRDWQLAQKELNGTQND